MSRERDGEDSVDEKVHSTGAGKQRFDDGSVGGTDSAEVVENDGSSVAIETADEAKAPRIITPSGAQTPIVDDDASSSSSSSTTACTRLNTASTTTTPLPPPPVPQDAEAYTYPEGGLRAWLVVLGSFCGMTACFGLMNSIGIFQSYLVTHQLSNLSPSTVGWVFSIYTFLAFFCGVQIGPVFDAKGPQWLVAAGTVFLVGGTFAVAESTELWHFILSFSVAAGLGTSLIFTPAVSSIAHFFMIRRAAAVGLATTGGSFGGIIFPLMLQRLFPELGFRWATRTLAFIFLVLCIIANILIRSRLPPPKSGTGTGLAATSIWPDWRIFKNKTFALTTAGVFFVEWALFVPLGYISSYSLAADLSPAFSYQLLAILNVGSFFGRWAPGYGADKLGRFNTMIITVSICLVSVLTLWLTCGHGPHIIPQLVAFALIFGFASGSNISLVPVCVGQLCGTEVFGRWYAGLYTVVSFGCLTGIPIAGSILGKEGGGYAGLIVFVGVSYAVGLCCFVWARVLRVGWGVRTVF